jgi:hypothetical protein
VDIRSGIDVYEGRGGAGCEVRIGRDDSCGARRIGLRAFRISRYFQGTGWVASRPWQWGGDRVGKFPSRMLSLGLAVWVTFACSPPVFAQTTPHPITAEGGAVPGRPDLSGVWSGKQNADTFSANEPPLQAWAEAKFKSVKPGYGPHASALSEDPISDCLPPGVPRIFLIPFPMQIVQLPGEVVILFEYDHFVLHIYTDRKEHPKNMDPTWMGDSIGRWEGDTLVVDTVGLTDKSWLDQVGHPHSDALHVVERIRRVDHGTLQDDFTINDPKAYTKPWTGQRIFKLRTGWQLMEYICEDHMEEPNKH